MKTPRARWPSLASLLLAAAPARAAQVVEQPLELTPFAALEPRSQLELVPVREGDAVLVSTTLRLYVFEAATGARRWTAGPPAGWHALRPDDQKALFAGLDGRRGFVAPAAGGGVALAALQVPMARHETDLWQGIVIQNAIPERRLFAFDLATGRALWDHAPPPGWNGTSGPFAQRMRVVGPPLVAGGSVLVPCSYDESSIDYQVACYALDSGELRWRTFVTRGQVERAYLGGEFLEFVAAPLVLDAARGRVIAQSGLGLLVALDLSSGEIVWRAGYEPIPLAKTRSYQPPRRAFPWRMTPPLVVGDTLLATPPDSAVLLALDLGDGHELWRRSVQALSALDHRETMAFDQLIGAEGGVLYLGGAKLGALEIVGGLRSPRFPVSLWTRPVEKPEACGRAQLSGETLLVPTPSGSRVFERGSGEPRGSIEHEEGRGVLCEKEALFVLTAKGLRRIER